jgi:uncharacterized membrane protein YgcG
VLRARPTFWLELVCGMTVAPEYLIRPALSGRRRVRSTRRWEHALVVLGICLPVPLAAATGLAIPLPTTVERLAAALVPWTNASAIDENQTTATSGSIMFAPGERPTETLTPSAATNPRAAAPSSASSDGKNHSQGDGSQSDAGTGAGSGSSESSGGSGSPGGSSGSGGSGGSMGGDDPADPLSPVKDTVDDVGAATQPVADEVEDTVNDVVDATDDAVGGLLPDAGG